MKTLAVGKQYDLKALQCVGWIDISSPDGRPEFGATEGYHWEDYFRDGEYLGHDTHGIEPLFEEVAP